MLLDPPQAIPNAAYLIYRYLRYAAVGNRATKMQVIRDLAPNTLVTNDAVCRHSLEMGVLLELWRELTDTGETDTKPSKSLNANHDDRIIVLSDDLLAGQRDERFDRAFFRMVLRRHVFDPALNVGPWLSQDGTYDFNCAMAWLLEQDTANPPGTWESVPKFTVPSVQRMQTEQLGNSPDVWLIKNGTRWDPFLRWASYLGLISRQVLDGKVLAVPSPVDAVIDVLPSVFQDGTGQDMRAEDFVGALAAELPVVDGGLYRMEVMAHMSGPTLRREEGKLSSSLSYALLILHQLGKITLEDRADASKLGLTNGPAELLRFSHARMKM